MATRVSKLNVFVSRPTAVPDDSFSRFERVLRARGFRARTLGVSADRALEAPLGEVCKLMECCQGAIILGYPRDVSLLASGSKRMRTRDARTTEWNQIEAGIAYGRGLPVLLIADETVSGGVFKEGAANLLIQRVDLADANWPNAEALKDAVRAFKDKLLEPQNAPNVVSIRDPAEGSFVLQQTVIRGTCPSNSEVFVVIHPAGYPRFYLQGEPYYSRSGEWEVPATVGARHDSGKIFEIRAFIGPATPIPREANDWPRNAVYESRWRFVIRA